MLCVFPRPLLLVLHQLQYLMFLRVRQDLGKMFNYPLF